MKYAAVNSELSQEPRVSFMQSVNRIRLYGRQSKKERTQEKQRNIDCHCYSTAYTNEKNCFVNAELVMPYENKHRHANWCRVVSEKERESDS